MVIGLALETIADDQKQRAKNVDKDAFCYTGLYRKIRHPNFLGEILFHIGLYCTMVAATGQFYTLIIGAYGTGWLLMLMSNEAALNDRKQQARHGDTQRYAEYRRSTGLLWPRPF
jgi:steroid 5-alpha reductase family enzyme